MKGQTQKKQALEKEDYLAPTKLENIKPIAISPMVKNLSDKEMQEKLQLYQRIGHQRTQVIAFEKLM